MNALLQLLTDTFRIFLDIIPRVYKVSANERGIKFKTGDKISVLSPGIYLYVPLIHKMEKKNISNRSMILNRQSLITKDGEKVTIIANVNYTISDIKKAIVDNNEVGELVNAEVSSDVCIFIRKHTLDEIMDNLDDHFGRDNSKSYENEYGVKIKKINIIDICTCMHLNNIDNKDYNKKGSI